MVAGGATRNEQHFGDRIVRCYSDRPANISAMVQRAIEADRSAEAIVDGERKISYGELESIVAGLAGHFSALGIVHGDRVATLIGNRPEFIFVLLACARFGAIAVPIGIRLKAPEIAFICNDSGASLLIHEASLEAQLPSAATVPALRHRFALAGDCEGSQPFASLLDPPAQIPPPAAVAEEDIFCISYTSGTTGKPKGALLTHLGVVHTCLNYRHVFGFEERETAILAAPANHVGGAGIIFPILDLGGRLVLMPEFKARKFLETAERERMTYGVGVPAMYNLLLLDPEFDRFDLSMWKWAFYSAAPMPEATIRRFAQALPQLTMLNCYGSTEATTGITMMPLGQGLERPDTVGQATPIADIIIVDDDGIEVPTGQVGELLVGGPMVVPGYWNDPTGTAASFIAGYWRSGDVASVDADGFYRIHDRKKDMINRGGLKIFCAEVENVLSDHPGIVEAAVVGKPDSVLGERVCAYVVPRSSDVKAEDIRAFCVERLADYKIPEIITLLDAPLPRNSNGKIFKPVLVELASRA